MIELTRTHESQAEWKVKVLGVGGAGTHAVDRLSRDGFAMVDILVANTDARALSGSATAQRIVLGHALTRGLGAGGDPELGRAAAEETRTVLADRLAGSSLVVLMAGLGGGTGSGATPLIAQVARELGAHVAVFATLPFSFEGRRRREQALEALDALRENADLVICFENDRIPSVADPSSGIEDAFQAVDSLLSQSVRALVSMTRRRNVLHSGLDEIAATVAEPRSTALFGFGIADGEERARAAVARAFDNPLLDFNGAIAKVSRLWVYVAGGADMRWSEVQSLMTEVTERIPEDVRLFFGAAVDPEMSGSVSVTLLAGIPDAASAKSFAPFVPRAERSFTDVPTQPQAPAQQAWTEPEQTGSFYYAEEPLAASSVHQPEQAPEEGVAGRLPQAAHQDELHELPEDWTASPPQASVPVEIHAEPETFWTAELPEASAASPAPEQQSVPLQGRMTPTPPYELHMERRREAALQAASQQSAFKREEAAHYEEPSSFLDVPPAFEPAPVGSHHHDSDLFEVPAAQESAAEGRTEPVSQQALVHADTVASFSPSSSDSEVVLPRENGKRVKDGVQEQMRFDAPNRGGRFEKTDPTIVDGEDLDVPTFMRQRLPLE